MRLSTGEIVDGRFIVERIAGSGGMGTVYRAVDRRTGNLVALKLVHDEDPEAARRFEQEAQSLADLDHPHVVRYVARGAPAPGLRYLAMEWLEGESLTARLARAQLSVEETILLGARVARALEAAHARGMIHRDIKPSNLFIVDGDVERVKVIDFGIAQMTAATRRLTATGTALGTPGYMAPEQTRGDGTRVDGRADLFSLGAVLFECLTGRPAFEGKHLMALLARLLFEEAPRIRDRRPELPRALDDLVARLLAKEPSARPPDAAAVARVLEAMDDTGRGSIRAGGAEPDAPLGRTERRLFSIVAVLPQGAREGIETDATVLTRQRIGEIEKAMRPLEARVDALANGALFVTLVATGSATDLAARAARAALALRPLLPMATITLVTGLGEATDALPVGELAERAVTLLDTAERYGNDGEIPIDDVTAALLDGRFDVVRTKEGPALRAERDVSGHARTLLGRPSPYLGRDRELRMALELVSASLEDGSPRAVIILGAAGMGKSRLRHEIVERIRRSSDPEVAIEVGRGDSIAQGSPFSILASALRSTAQITAGEPLAVQRKKLENALGARLSEERRARVVEFLGEMVGIPFPDDASPKLRAARQSAALMADRIREAYLEYMQAELAAQPRLVVLEDLHWGDAASIKLVDAALGALEGRPFVVLALARPEVRDAFPRLWDEREVQEVRLGALPNRAAGQLVRHFLGGDVSAAEVDRLVSRAAGNAFYLEELVRAVAEGRGDELPETVLGMVESRLLSIDPDARRLLRVASVFGGAFWDGALATLLGEDERRVASTLASLEARELVQRREDSRFSGQAEYHFRHALIREGSYAALTDRDRAVAHARAGAWLLAAGEEDPKVLAEHFSRANDADQAIRYYARAAEQSLAAGDTEAAVAVADRALGLGATGEQAAELRALQTNAWTRASQFVRAHEAAQVALLLATPGGLSHARALAGVIANGLFLRRLDVIGEAMDQLLRVEPAPEAISALAWAFNLAVTSLLLGGRRDAAEAYLRRMEEVTREAASADPSVEAWLAASRAYWVRFVERDVWAALALDRASARAFEEAGDGLRMPLANAHIGQDLTMLGAFEEAEDAITRAVAGAQPGSTGMLLSLCMQAWLRLEQGRLDEAIALCDEVIAGAEAVDEGLIGLTARYAALEARMGRGESQRVLRELEALEEACRSLPYMELLHLTLRAAALLAEGRAAEAVEAGQAALGKVAALGMGHYHRHALLFLTHAEALSAAGRADEAREAIERGKADLLARAGRIEDPEARRQFLERVPHHARTMALWEALMADEHGAAGQVAPPAP
ncbi:serine/threonine-protein kinase [Polyangium aurulentum]|uniref:serine/threonine-protein kinase n=1 Tax=Polyangium aurulentum TaxID=2567896 RepID=UPI001F286DD9|nr:serine/threonine-protein kinase [Polyangium aurulentum]